MLLSCDVQNSAQELQGTSIWSLYSLSQGQTDQEDEWCRIVQDLPDGIGTRLSIFSLLRGRTTNTGWWLRRASFCSRGHQYWIRRDTAAEHTLL
jgi:hypothetical protein